MTKPRDERRDRMFQLRVNRREVGRLNVEAAHQGRSSSALVREAVAIYLDHYEQRRSENAS